MPRERSLVALVIELHRLAISPFFEFGPLQDPSDATHWIGSLDQGGLGLPDRDYYFRDDENSRALRATYEAHVARMLALAGLSPARAESGAAEVLKLETQLARASQTLVERRDPKHLYQRTPRARLEQLAPAFDWERYFAGLGLDGLNELNVAAPKFVEGLGALLVSTPPTGLRAYLQWHILRSAARQLSQPFVQESFRMDQALTGQAELRPRWRRCLRATDAALPDLLGQAYVSRRFTGESKAAAQTMVQAISAAFQRELDGLHWLDAATRQQASKKLAAMDYLIGFPDAWKRYDFEVARHAYLENVLRARAFDVRRELAKIGHAMDRREWQVSAPTADAFYQPQQNHMVFPAGILQPPLYALSQALPVNLGAIGMLMGHELTHGFDDEGAQFDGQGNLKVWWTPEVSERFQERTACVAQQYAAYELLPGLHLDGQLTLGENVADLGGARLAFLAYRALAEAQEQLPSAGGFNPDQQFFLALAQSWCGKLRPELELKLVRTDPHSPPRFRVRGALSHLPQFAEAFACPAHAPMRAEPVCTLW